MNFTVEQLQTGMAINQDNRRFVEVPIEVKEWAGMMSNYPDTVRPLNAFKKLLNVDFDGKYKISSRQGSQQYLGNAVTGAGVSILDGLEYKKATSTSRIIFATSDGKLYQSLKGFNQTPTLIGTLTNPKPIVVSMVQFADAVYIADGIDALKWDGTTLTSIKSTFPTISPLATGDILYVTTTRNQLFWADSNDYVYASAYNSDVFTEAFGGWKAQVQYGDGTRIKTMTPWGDTLLISKGDEERNFHLLYWLRGGNTTSDPYRIIPLFGDQRTPVAFIGKSAIQIQGDVIGLTLDGFTTATAINNFKEAKPENISEPIHDLVKRINFSIPWKINAIYDTVKRQYMCAVPMDGANYVTHILVYDIDGDRWTSYDNWNVRCWVRVGTDVLFGTENGRMVITRRGQSDEGNGFRKEVDRGNNHFGISDIIKLFKWLEIDLILQGDYHVDYYVAYDDVELATPIELGLLGTNALWNESEWNDFYWNDIASGRRNILLQGRGKTLGERFVNINADEPFTIVTAVNRMMVKDAGQAKAG